MRNSPNAKIIPGKSVSTSSANASGGNIVRNALMGYVSTAVGMILGLVVTPLLLRHLGSENFGIWILMASAISYTGLVELGLGAAIAKRVAECRATGDETRLEQVVSTALALYFVVAIFVLIIVGALQARSAIYSIYPLYK